MISLMTAVDYLPFVVTVLMVVRACTEGACDWGVLFGDLLKTSAVSLCIAVVAVIALCCVTSETIDKLPSRGLRTQTIGEEDTGKKDISVDTFTVFAAYSILQVVDSNGLLDPSSTSSKAARVMQAGGRLFIHAFIVVAVYENSRKVLRKAKNAIYD